MRARDGGPDALRSRPPPARPPKLPSGRERLIAESLWHGAEAYGVRGELWTGARIARVIEEELGVRYHKGHVGRRLQEWRRTPQLPMRRALRRDEEALRGWRAEVWPERRRRAWRERRGLVFEGESGVYLPPGLVRTYAPRAQTPVIREEPTRDPLSVMGGRTPAGEVSTPARRESLNGRHTVEFLAHLLRVAGKRLLVIRDGSPIHRRRAVPELVAGTEGNVSVEALPGYAPELNPWDEGGWNHLQHVGMRNLVCRDLEEPHAPFHLAVGRLRQKPHLAQSFLAQAGLGL